MSSAAQEFRVRVPRIAEDAVERARLSVVPRIRRQSAPRVPFLTLVSAVLLAGVVGLLLFNTNMQQAAFSGKALEQQARTLAAREQTLRLELEQLRNPQRIAQQAQRLGMGIPASTGFLHLGDGSVTGVAQPVTADSKLALRGRPAVKPLSIAPRPRIVVGEPSAVSAAPAVTPKTPVVASTTTSATDPARNAEHRAARRAARRERAAR